MTNDQKLKKTFATLGNGNDLSAGICGPDGCEIDWDKLDKKNQTKDQKDKKE